MCWNTKLSHHWKQQQGIKILQNPLLNSKNQSMYVEIHKVSQYIKHSQIKDTSRVEVQLHTFLTLTTGGFVCQFHASATISLQEKLR